MAGFAPHVAGGDHQPYELEEVISVKNSRMEKNQRYRCPECRSVKSVSRGYRKTVDRTANKRVCKNCGSWFSVLA